MPALTVPVGCSSKGAAAGITDPRRTLTQGLLQAALRANEQLQTVLPLRAQRLNGRVIHTIERQPVVTT